ncbi:MAG: ERF family protein [Lachnospiraceae bacterium]|nr:ERF family protein [Lachnospiraceae bacterium]
MGITEGKIYKAIPNIMGEINAVGKNKQNTQQGFMYRGIDDVMNAINPALVKHNVFIVPEILEQSREERQTARGGNLIYSICKIKFRFCADDGSSIEAVTIGEGMDSGDKATNKAMAVAFKYACFQVFCIPTEEMKDPDAETPPNSKAAQETGNVKVDAIKISTLRDKAMKKGVSEKSILEHYKIVSFNDMDFKTWHNAMQLLDKYKDVA